MGQPVASRDNSDKDEPFTTEDTAARRKSIFSVCLRVSAFASLRLMIQAAAGSFCNRVSNWRVCPSSRGDRRSCRWPLSSRNSERWKPFRQFSRARSASITAGRQNRSARVWLGDDDVADEGERCRHAAHGRVGEEGK